MEALRPTSNSQGKQLNCSFSHGLHVIVYIGWILKMIFRRYEIQCVSILQFLGSKILGQSPGFTHLGYHDGTRRDQLLQLLLQACLGLTFLTQWWLVGNLD